MGTPAERLGGLVRDRRETMGFYTVVDAAGRSGLSRETWTKVERGEPAAPATYRKIEDLLQWEPGSCGAVLDGGEPTLQTDHAELSLLTLTEQLDDITGRLRRIEKRLAEEPAEPEEEKRRHA